MESLIPFRKMNAFHIALKCTESTEFPHSSFLPHAMIVDTAAWSVSSAEATLVLELEYSDKLAFSH